MSLLLLAALLLFLTTAAAELAHLIRPSTAYALCAAGWALVAIQAFERGLTVWGTGLVLVAFLFLYGWATRAGGTP